MNLTLEDLKLLIEEMEKEQVTEIHLDITSCGEWALVESIDFDIWRDNRYIKTILTKERG